MRQVGHSTQSATGRSDGVEILVPLASLGVAGLSVLANIYAVRSSRAQGAEGRIFERRVQNYRYVVAGIVELRDYARKPGDESEPPPLLNDDRWLEMLANVEMLASEKVRQTFEVIPGRVNRYRAATAIGSEERTLATPGERRDDLEFVNRQRRSWSNTATRSLPRLGPNLGCQAELPPPQASR